MPARPAPCADRKAAAVSVREGCRAQAGAEQQRRPRSRPRAPASLRSAGPAPPPRSTPSPAPAWAAAPPGDGGAGPGLGGTRHLWAHPLRRALAHALHVHHLHVSSGVRGDGAVVVPSRTRHRSRSARAAGLVRRAASAPGRRLPCPGCQPGDSPACLPAMWLPQTPPRHPGVGLAVLRARLCPCRRLRVKTVLWFSASCSVRGSLLRCPWCCWGRLGVCCVLVCT